MALTLESLKPIFPKYDYKCTDRAKEACSTYLSEKNPFNLPLACEYKMEGEQVPPYGGGQPTTKVIDWKGKSRGLFFHHPQGNVNVICVKLSEDCKGPVPVICRERTKTRCTQTRYRESSAQTRPYQPEVAGEKENYQKYEVYQLAKLLDGYEPPGEYEIKVVERARRRRQYEKVLEMTTNDKQKHRTVLEAMEWEDWIAREEDMQDCQMLRMEIVARMFKDREEKLHDLSEKRISCSAERIQAKRTSQINKINTEFARGMRRLEAKRQQITRNYRKGNITQEHIDPASDLNAPQMRFGVNPNRRHFVGFRKNFDDRINELDKKKDGRGLASLSCPFSKLRSWAKPKQRMKEVSQRFCSDENLRNLYESLKGLRTISEAPKSSPKCLKKKTKQLKPHETVEAETYTFTAEPEESKEDQEKQPVLIDEKEKLPTNKVELIENVRQRRSKKLSSKTDEEIASIVGGFEGTTLGKLLQFLSNELERLKIQKKFQAIYMLAERERWHREACEAGLRQKENKLREDNENLFKAACEVHRDTASSYLESVLEEEFSFTAETLAEEKITELAKKIDAQDRESMKLQGRERLIYDRMNISDYVHNQVFALAEKRLGKMKADKLKETQLKAIEEELFASVENALSMAYNPSDSVIIVGELLDELIANAVTYHFGFDIFTPCSSDSEFDTEREVNEVINKLLTLVVRKPGEDYVFTDSTDFETHLTAEKEAKAIIRKLVRQSITEKRWKCEGERVVEQTLSETFNDAIYEVECLKASRFVRANDQLSKVISEIYNRMGGYRKKESVPTEESSDFELSACLRSIRSTIDIFKESSDAESSPGNTSNFEEEFHAVTTKKVEYMDPSHLEKFEPVEIDLRHERYNIMGKVARCYRDKEDGEISSEDSDVSVISSDAEFVSYTSQYMGTFKSEQVSMPRRWTIHPELSIDEERSCSRLRLCSSYERASASYERVSGGYRTSNENKRSESY